MKLIVAEKKSVGEAIARVVGADKNEKEYYIGNGYMVSWCAGHLVGPGMPEIYDSEYKKWNMTDLPIIPEKWKYEVTPDKKWQYNSITKLMNRPDIDCLINACDAGREGELIFRLVYEKADCKKPVERLWVSSIEKPAIKAAMENLKPGSEYDNMYQAALCRQRADWLVGINETRYYTVAYDTKLSVGRVQTPTLNMVVKRHKERESFLSEPYYVITADCGSFKATTRETSKAIAEKMKSECTGPAYVTKVEKEDKTKKPPELFSLSTLQSIANAYFGYTLQETLDLAQTLYEKKLATYPRTESNYLTSDMAESSEKMLNALLNDFPTDFMNDDIRSQNSWSLAKAIDDKKVSDHHAILPTAEILTYDLSTLPDSERNILMLIVGRVICTAADSLETSATRVNLDINGHPYSSSGTEVLHAGYKSVEDAMKTFFGVEQKKNQDVLPNMTEGNEYALLGVSVESKMTQPPKLYTDSTLLEALKNVASIIDDPELKAAIKNVKGIGTEATRSGILEKLVSDRYLSREGKGKVKNLVPTQKGIVLIGEVIQDLKDPVTSAEWEQKLDEISQGKYSPEEFIKGIEDSVKEHIEVGKQFFNPEVTKGIFPDERESLGVCPRCKKNVFEGKKNFYCESGRECGFTLWKEDKFFTNKGKKLSIQTVRDLLGKGTAIIKGCKSNKTDKTYDIKINLKDSGQYISYNMDFMPYKKKTITKAERN